MLEKFNDWCNDNEVRFLWFIIYIFTASVILEGVADLIIWFISR